MAIGITYKSSVKSTTAATSYTCSPTWTPQAQSLAIAFVVTCLGSTPLDPTSVTGHGVSYSKLTLSARTLSTTHAVSVWVAKMGASPTSVACVASYGAVSQTGGAVIEFEITGHDNAGTALQAIVQNPTNTGTATSGSVTLSSPGYSYNRPMSFWLHLANEATTPRANWTETSGADGNFNSPATGAEGQFRTGAFETTASATWSTSSLWRGVAVEIKSVLVPQTIAVAQVTEAELSQASAWAPKKRFVTQNIETDTLQAIAELKYKIFAQISETDLSQAFTVYKPKTIAVVQVTEADLSQAVGKRKTKAIGQPSETNLSQVINEAKQRVIVQTTEVNLSQTVAKLKRKAITQSTETDLSQLINKSKNKLIEQFVEFDLSQSVSVLKIVTVGQITETDLPQSVSKLKNSVIDQCLEVDLSQDLGSQKARQLARASETDISRNISLLTGNAQYINITRITEHDLARNISINKIRQIDDIDETDLSQAISAVRVNRILLDIAIETSLAQTLIVCIARRILINQAMEFDTAYMHWITGTLLVNPEDRTLIISSEYRAVEIPSVEKKIVEVM